MDDPRYRNRLETLFQHYGRLDDFEAIVTDLDQWSNVSVADRGCCPFSVPGAVAADLRSAIADFFSQIRSGASLYHQLAKSKIKGGDVVVTFTMMWH